MSEKALNVRNKKARPYNLTFEGLQKKIKRDFSFIQLKFLEEKGLVETYKRPFEDFDRYNILSGIKEIRELLQKYEN